MSDELLTAADAAELLKVSPSTITRLCQRNELRSLKVGRQLRFRRQWLDAYIDGSNAASNPTPKLQSVMGPARSFPPLRGGRKGSVSGRREAS